MNLPDRHLQPSDISELYEDPPRDLIPWIDRAIAEGSPSVRSALRGLFVNRSLRVLRGAPRQDLLEEAVLVSAAVSGDAGGLLHAQDAETFGAFFFLQALLGEAGRRSDRAAVAGILRGTRGPAILELVAAEGRPVQRSEIRRRLGLGEAQLSHLLRDLEEAELIRRFRPEKGKEILVELGPVGREVVRSEVLPLWVEVVIQALSEIRHGHAVDPANWTPRLMEAGAPSELAARKLVEGLAALALLPTQKVAEVRDGSWQESTTVDRSANPARAAFVAETAGLPGDFGRFASYLLASPGSSPVSQFVATA